MSSQTNATRNHTKPGCNNAAEGEEPDSSASSENHLLALLPFSFSPYLYKLSYDKTWAAGTFWEGEQALNQLPPPRGMPPCENKARGKRNLKHCLKQPQQHKMRTSDGFGFALFHHSLGSSMFCKEVGAQTQLLPPGCTHRAGTVSPQVSVQARAPRQQLIH